MKKLLTLCAAVLTSIGMYAAETVTFSWSTAGTSGYCYSQAGPTEGKLLTDNAIFFVSTNGPAVETISDSKYLNPQKTGFVFKPTTDVTLEALIQTNNANRTCTIYVDSVSDNYAYAMYKGAGTAVSKQDMCAYILANAANDDEKQWWVDGTNGKSIKISNNTYAAGTDSGAKKWLSGEQDPGNINGFVKRLGSSITSDLSGSDERTLSVKTGSTPHVFKAGKVYRVHFLFSSNNKEAIKSMTFTPTSQTVKYYNNGGTGTIADGTGASITLSDGTGFTAPSGYTFAGWNTAADGSGTAYAASATVTVSLNLYAQWTQTITLDANTANHGTGDNGSATALYNGTELSNIVHTTPATGYTLKGYYTAATDGVKVLNANGSFAATNVTGYITDGAWTKEGATTLYAQYAEPQTYSVTHTLTNVTATSGATGANAATQGTEYEAVFAADDEYSLPASVTVTIGGATQTEGEGYTYNNGTVTIPGAYVAGAIVITVAGVHNVCATPTITASTTFNFTNKGYAVTITNNEAGSTLKYSTDGTNWSDYSSALYATTTTTFYAKSVKDNYADSENATLKVTNSYDAEKKYVAWVYTKGYGSASYAFATDPMVIGLQADYNVVEVNLGADTNPTTATDIAEADLIVCSEAMTGNKTLSNNMKTYAGSTPMIGLKAFNYTKGRWSWGTPANPSSTTTSFTPKYSNYKVLNGVTFESDGSIKLATASSGNVIQTVEFGTTDCTAPAGNVIMGNLDDVDTKAVMYASTKYFGLGLSSDCWETYTANAVTIVKNAAAMLIAGEALDVLVYAVTYSAGDGSVKEGEALPTQAATVAGDKFNLASGDALEKSGYIFDGWLCNVDAVKYAAGDEYTMTAAATSFTAQWEALNYTVTLAAGTYAKTAGEANIDYDATALDITTAPTGTGALLGFFTAASEGTKVANADGTLVEGTVEGYVTEGKWSRASATTLYAVYDGVPTALDNTVDGLKAVKFIENGKLFIRRGDKVFDAQGQLVK